MLCKGSSTAELRAFLLDRCGYHSDVHTGGSASFFFSLSSRLVL
jgi:hypothetical protein